MSNLPIDPTALRQELERQLDAARQLEHAHILVGLAQRLDRRQHEFLRRDLMLAFHPKEPYPALYILRRDHSAWCRIWYCHDGLRLDATCQGPGFEASSCHEVMNVRLTADLDLAESCVMRLLDRNELRLGNYYLPGDLVDIGSISIPTMPGATLPALELLPSRTLPATVRPQLRAVPLRAITDKSRG